MTGINQTCAACDQTQWYAERHLNTCSCCREWKRRRFDEVVALLWQELLRAEAKHAPMVTPHHGLSVIRGEFRELEAEVDREKSDRMNPDMKREAIHVATMGVRFLMDLGKGE